MVSVKQTRLLSRERGMLHTRVSELLRSIWGSAGSKPLPWVEMVLTFTVTSGAPKRNFLCRKESGSLNRATVLWEELVPGV